MEKRSVETAVGIFVLIGILCVAYMAIKLGQMQWLGDDTYVVEAYFNSVSGLKSGAIVEMAGVEIGQVNDIGLDQQSNMARVDLKIKKEVELNDDVIASVRTSGLIGDKYIMLTPGGSGQPLAPGETIMDTESSLDIEELISKFLFEKI